MRFPFNRLPLDLWIQILEIIASVVKVQSSQEKTKHKFASLSVLASVSLEWQSVFESKTFSTMSITSCELDRFERLTQGKSRGRLDIIRNLTLSVMFKAIRQEKCDPICQTTSSRSVIALPLNPLPTGS
jgi:hypothetical protein